MFQVNTHFYHHNCMHSSTALQIVGPNGRRSRRAQPRTLIEYWLNEETIVAERVIRREALRHKQYSIVIHNLLNIKCIYGILLGNAKQRGYATCENGADESWWWR